MTSFQKVLHRVGISGMICAIFISFSLVSLGQTDGDYQTRSTGIWSANTTWQVRTGGAWVNCSAGDYPGATAGSGTVNILNSHSVTLTTGSPVTVNGNLVINTGATLAFDLLAARTLNVGGDLSGDGTMDMSPGNLTHTLNLGGATNHIGLLITSSTAASTINYNRTGDQTVFDSPAYRNLTFSGSGNKSISGDITVSGNIILNNTAYMSVTANISFSGANFTINSTSASPFNATSGTFTFTGANQSIANVAGTGSITFFNLTAAGTQIKTINRSFTVTNDLIINNLVTLSQGNFQTTNNVLGNVTVDGTLDFGTLTPKTFNVTGDLIDVSGTITMAGAGLAHNLNLGGTNNAITTLNAIAGNTISYNRSGDQQVFGSSNYQNVNISGGGVKTLQAGSSVNGILTLVNGILSLGSANLTIINNVTNAIQGNFSATNMIESGGTGSLIRSAVTTLPILFPVGSGGYFSPMSITALSSTSGAIRVRAVHDATQGSDYINEYWDVITTTAGKTISATFTYDPAEIHIEPSNIWYKPGSGNWLTPAGTSTFGAGSFTITGTTNITTSSTYWTAGALGTFYSYQTGDWNTPNTWTSDPSGTLQIGNTIPGLNEKVVILTGRTVSLSRDINAQGLDIIIDAGGFLNMAENKFTGTLFALRGQGTLQLASVDFPAPTINTFVIAGGGTTEYYNNINFTLPPTQNTYNNLTINTAGPVATQLSNLTLFGNLHVTSGTFRINDNLSVARLNLTINGDVTIDNGAFITVGNGSTNPAITSVTNGGTAPFINYYTYFHTVIIKGDLTNNGTVRFTNLPYPIYNAFPLTVSDATSGAASVYFQGPTDNVLTCNGATDFYNLILDKGIDQTYKLTINSRQYNNFRLFGANTLSGEATGSNANLRKALWIRTGTLVLEGSVIIPSLTEGITAGPPNSDFYIPSNGALEMNGVDVVIFSTADDYREINTAYGVSAPDNATIGISAGGNSSLEVYGRLKIHDGYFSTRESGGIITSNIASGQIIIEGGTVDSKQFLSSTGAAQYTQTGGTFILRGRFQRTPATFSTVADLKNVSITSLNTSRSINGINPAFGTFNLENPANIFTVSGGTIRIYDVCGTGALADKAFDVKSSPSNINVTGGTLEIIPLTGSGSDAGNFSIFTNAPLNNFVINRASSTSTVLLNTPLIVLNDLNLISGNLNANSNNISVGGDFTIEAGTDYLQGTNTTIFNGTDNQIFTINLASALTLNRLTIDKPSGIELEFAGTQKTINISDNFRLVSGTLKDNGNVINVYKDVYNSGVQTGTGKMVFLGTVTQQIDGNGIFNNIDLDNNTAVAAPVSLVDSMKLDGTLTFSVDKIFNIGSYNLTLNPSASIVNESATRYIQTAGNSGDGGVTKIYTSTAAFLFPVGAPTLIPARAVKYTPATIGFTSAPATYGSITVVPVGYEHPATTVNGQSLTYYWRVKSSGFSGMANSITHEFVYDQTDVAGTEGNYIPSLYNRASYAWNNGTAASINISSNTITDWATSSNLLDADYTAGDAAFNETTKFYSRRNGIWSDASTWSYTGHGGVAATTIPGANDIVIIGNNNTVTLTEIANCASLQIASGSVLDIHQYSGSNFGMVLNHPSGSNGLFRLHETNATPSVYIFPSGDFSDFNVNKGTVEFYTNTILNTDLYILPANVTSYGNLILSPSGGANLSLPNNSLTTIYGDLTCNSSNPRSWITMSWNTTRTGTYWYSPTLFNPTIEKTVHIVGNMYVNGGTFMFMDDYAPQHLIVDGDVVVGTTAGSTTGAGIYALDPAARNRWVGSPTPVANTLAIGGNLINNSNDSSYGGIQLYPNTYYCDVTFFGSTPASVKSTTGDMPNTTFHKVAIDKGTSQLTTLTFEIGGTLNTPRDNWLTLQNGTFRYMRTNPNNDFTISTITPFTIPSTAGLYVDYSNTGSISILIGNSAVNSNDLVLDGGLTIVNGNVYVGPVSAPANNNDIEYSGSGSSSIEVRGGNLVVNGQIRRPVETTNGVLNYTQSGGNVIINGNNSLATKAKLEVLNDGSVFNMSGGTLTIVHGGGTSFGDLYLRPGSSSVTGGTIVFSHNLSGANQTYGLEANVPLNNLTITGRTVATPANATVGLMVSPLVLNGSITLSNRNSILNSNNLNIFLKGDLNNNGFYNYGTNLTGFNGGFQSITGTTVTDFYDLDVSPLNSLTVNNSFAVNRNLTIGSGNILLGSNRITLSGNLINNGSYTDNNTASGISLSGAVQQEVAGDGAFGRLEVNNNSGVRLNSDITLQNDLVLSRGVLDINKNQLTLNQNSIISGAPFNVTKMIKSDGVASNLGVVKFFNAGAQSFVFPVGVSGKYTPASYTILASEEVGSIGVNPVNNRHSSITDPLNALNYYWQIKSSGIQGFYGNVLLQYKPGDVAGLESEYVAARLALPGNYWYKAPTGSATDNVDENAHIINFIDSGSNNLTGDYTAGNDASFPSEVPSYRTTKDGNWSDLTVWAPVGSSPPCLAGGPNGANVIIDHIVTTDINNIYALSTTINRRLIVNPPTFNHNLGVVDGDGTIYLMSGNLPAGNYSAFLDCSGNGTIEYGGSGTYTIIASLFSSVPNMLFTGTGTRILPNKDLTICKKLVIDGPTLDNSVNKSKLTILGTMERYNTGTFISGSGTSPASTVSFAGQSVQTIGGATGNFSGENKFNNLEIKNAAGLNIGANGLIEVENELLLTNGIINTTATNKLVLLSTSPAVAIPAGGSGASFVNGPLIKKIVNGGSFLYPVGKGTIKGHNFTLTSTDESSLIWTVECFMPNLTAASLTDPLKVSNTKEYWSVNSTVAASGKIKIGWDTRSDPTPLMTPNGLSDMRVAEYNTGSWKELASVATGNNDIGDVATTSSVNITLSPQNFTTASVTMTNARASFDPTGPVCGTSGIPISFTSFNPIDLNYTLDYTINGVSQPTLTVTSATYILPTPVPGAYKLTGFTFHVGAEVKTGVVDKAVINVYSKPTDANAGPDRSLCGVSGLALAGNNPAPYSGLWTKVSGAGGTFINNTRYNTDFTGILGKTYILRWTISNFSCTSSDDVVISFPVEAAMPSNFMSAPTQVCLGSTGYVYSVPGIPGNTYSWSYTGTGHTIHGTGSSVTIDFSPTATSGTLSVTTTNICGTSVPRSIPITVNSLPVAVAGDNRTICANVNTTLGGAPIAGSTYRWSSVPAGFVSTAANPVVSPSSTTTYTVIETNSATGCSGSSSVVVTILTSPVAVAGNNGPVCLGNVLNLTAPSGMTTYLWTGPDAFSSTLQNPTVSTSAVPQMTGSYILTVTNSIGCSGIDTTEVIVNDLLIPTLISSDADNMFCAESSVTFTAGGGIEYDFRVSGVSVQKSELSTYTTTTLSDGQIVDVIVTNSGGCSATSPGITNRVNPLPTASLISSDADNSFCTGTVVVFTAGGGTSYNFRINGVSVQDGGSPVYSSMTLTNGQVVDVIVTDAGGCSAISTGITNIVNPLPTVTGTHTDVLCYGAATGTIDITVTGGTGPYTFAWSGAGVSPLSEDQTNLAAGPYSVIVTDVNGCISASLPVIIVQTSLTLAGNINSQTNVSTYGNNDGSVTVSGSGGIAPYQYKMGSGVYQDSGIFETLTAGIYTVTVQDINLCTFDITVTITQPPEPLSGRIASKTNVPCFGTSTGSVTITGSGGKTPYEYRLDAGSYQPSGTFENLPVGTYVVTVRDSELTTFDVNVTLTQPSSVLGGSISSQTNVLCFGGNTGSVTVYGSGGTLPYLYKLGSGQYQSSETFGTLLAGVYTITVQDANNCTFNISATITQPQTGLVGSVESQKNVSCFGLSDGSLSVTGAGGAGPYLFSLNDGTYQASGTFSGLAAAAYSITMRDANLCTTTVYATITQPEVISISPVKDDVSCPGDSDGKIALTITGGSQPYNVNWADGVLTSDRLNIPEGTYSVVVTDKNGCNGSLDIIVGTVGTENCLVISQIITPNNDGHNDTWVIKNIDLFPNAEVFIYTRWGRLVFSTKNISANPWNGTDGGKLLPTDSYHYILHLNDGSKPKSGVISIIR